MKKSLLVLVAVLSSFAARAVTKPEIGRWDQQARNVTIIRDDWGIAHVYGKTNADAVFGAEYAQAEDDFNRVETNYINAMGRLAGAEGESKIYQDLRMKLFIDPDALYTSKLKNPAPWPTNLFDHWNSRFLPGRDFLLDPQREAHCLHTQWDAKQVFIS